MIDDLLLLSRADIPFEEAQITIHQPMIKEIAMIGEEAFHYGSKFLNFSLSCQVFVIEPSFSTE